MSADMGDQVRSGLPELTSQVIDHWKSLGYSQSDIAYMYGVTPQYVSKKKKQGDFSQTARESAMEHYPWKVPRSQQDSGIQHRMRDHMEYAATMGLGMSDFKLQRLFWFYRKLDNENLVVEHDPDILPTEGNKPGGFAYRERRPQDGGLIIRVNEYTVLTEEGQRLLQFPSRLPQCGKNNRG